MSQCNTIVHLAVTQKAFPSIFYSTTGLLSSASETTKHSETNKALINNYAFERDIYTQF